jgi:hypothetical protein
MCFKYDFYHCHLVLLLQQLFHLSTFYCLYRLPEDGQMSGRNMQEAIVNKSYLSSVHVVAVTTVLYRVKGQLSKTEVYALRKLT